MTPAELERYRAARAKGDVVRVRQRRADGRSADALCMGCIRSAIGRRPSFTGVAVNKDGQLERRVWACMSHEHMVKMGPGPTRSAELAREARATLRPKPKAPA